jgi:hypothetical protein
MRLYLEQDGQRQQGEYHTYQPFFGFYAQGEYHMASVKQIRNNGHCKVLTVFLYLQYHFAGQPGHNGQNVEMWKSKLSDMADDKQRYEQHPQYQLGLFMCI